MIKFWESEDKQEFKGFRPLEESDREWLARAIDSDDDHRKKGMTPDFWFNEVKSVVFCDEKGPVVAMGLEPVVELHLQANLDAKQRNAPMLVAGTPVFAAMVKQTGAKSMLFESVVKPLIRFCKQRLGFEDAPNLFRHRL